MGCGPLHAHVVNDIRDGHVARYRYVVESEARELPRVFRRVVDCIKAFIVRNKTFTRFRLRVVDQNRG